MPEERRPVLHDPVELSEQLEPDQPEELGPGRDEGRSNSGRQVGGEVGRHPLGLGNQFGGEDGQEQAETAEQLADYLRRRGLSGADATRVAESAWMARPEDASEHAAPPPREGLVSATGFSVGVIVLMFIAFAVLYLFVLR